MINVATRQQFRGHTIAQADGEDYEAAGYVVIAQGDFAAISAYGHCSCYDTWDDLTSSSDSEQVRWDWTGTIADLKRMAAHNLDPSVSGRTAAPDDHDYTQLMEVYKQVLAWFELRELA